MDFPRTYEYRYETNLRQLLIHYEKNKWIWYKVSRADKHNGLRIRTHADNPERAGMFENPADAVGFLDRRGSHSDPAICKFVINQKVSKDRINDLVAEIQEYSKKY